MKNSDIIAFTFREEQARIAASPLYSHPTASLWQRCLSVGSLFCEAAPSHVGQHASGPSQCFTECARPVLPLIDLVDYWFEASKRHV